MNIKHEYEAASKVMGRRAASLVRRLYDAGVTTFSVADAIRIGEAGEKAVRRVLTRLVSAGVIARVKPGLYNIVPFELGNQRNFLGSAPRLAVEIARRALPPATPIFISHATAMALHHMVTQPFLSIYVTTPKQIRPVFTMGTEIRFVAVKPGRLFGYEEQWIDKETKLPVSDLERTILDGLRQPEYCGGIGEVAKGMWIKRQAVNVVKLVEYARRLDIGAVAMRLGFLLELYDIANADTLKLLQMQRSSTYHLIDPDMPDEGRYHARWRLRLNLTPDELRAIVRT